MEVFRWGIIGPGEIAQAFVHDLSFAKTVTHKVNAVLGRNKERTESFASSFSVPQTFISIHEFVKQAEIDGVYVSTPHSLHYEQALTCLQNRIPVLCEKPVTINSTQLLDLIKASEEKKTFLMEAMWVRFLPGTHKLLSIIADGSIGEIISIKTDIGFTAPKDPSNRFYNPDLAGGSLLDLGVYPVFLFLLLLGKPPEIKVSGTIAETGVDSNCVALFSYEKGRTAVFESSIISNPAGIATIYGEKGFIRIRHPWFEKPEGIDLELYDGSKTFFKNEWKGKGLYFQVDEMHQCLTNGQRESPLYCQHFSLDVMQTMDEIRRQLGVKYPKE